MSDDKISVQLFLNKKQKTQLHQESKRLNIPQTTIIRLAIDQYFNKNKPLFEEELP